MSSECSMIVLLKSHKYRSWILLSLVFISLSFIFISSKLWEVLLHTWGITIS